MGITIKIGTKKQTNPERVGGRSKRKRNDYMSTPCRDINLYTQDGKHLTPQEAAFIASYIVCKNGAQAVREAGYKSRTPGQQACSLLARDYITKEINLLLKEQESRKIADADEILQFYTSVMRGQVLDQFGIEASLDTRIKAANELAKHKIEIPLKLQQRQDSNNLGSITLNFLPRKDESNEENE